MTTSKGTIQGYNEVATVDKKHQIIIDAQAFGSGQEQNTLEPVLDAITNKYKRLKILKDIYKSGAIVTADTGFPMKPICSICIHKKSMYTFQIICSEVETQSLAIKS